MRRLVLIAILGACDERGAQPSCTVDGHVYELDEVWPAGDGCNSCTCTPTGPACTRLACVDAGIDANPASCEASGGCPEGPSCGAVCCGTGEKCVGGTCTCGNAGACAAGVTCSTAGPIGGDACGSICCGTSGPCPL